jgi:hypothetical protein
MVSIIKLLLESWGKIPRTLYVHKLIKCDDYTMRNIDKLVEIGVLDNNEDIYLYSFIHPDSNRVVSFTGSKMLKPRLNFKLWFAPVTPLRVMIYKGASESNNNITAFSAEKVASKRFSTTSYLFSGEETIFKKVADIPIDVISTTVPIPVGPIFGLYENYDIDCDENKQKLRTINIKRVKAMAPIPQMLMKTNYVFVYSCKTT